MIRKLIVCLAVAGLCQVVDVSAQPQRRVVFIGDSITDGNWGDGGGAKPSAQRNHWDQNHLFGSGYMYLCAAYYMSKYPGEGLVFFNRGISGNTLGDLVARWDEDVLALRPDVLSVLVGINDVDRHTREGAPAFDLEGWKNTFRDLLERARAQNPGMLIVLGTPFTSRSGYSEDTERCAAAIRHIAADYGAICLPYDEMFEGLLAEYPAVPASHWLWDGIHPTAAGHQRMARMWIENVGRFWE